MLKVDVCVNEYLRKVKELSVHKKEPLKRLLHSRISIKIFKTARKEPQRKTSIYSILVNTRKRIEEGLEPWLFEVVEECCFVLFESPHILL